MKKLNYIKQSLLAVVVLLVCVTIFREWLGHAHPEAAQFDFWSQTETFAFRFSQYLTLTLSTWFFLWVVFPKVHHYLANFDTHFEALPQALKARYGLFIWAVVLISFLLLMTSAKAQGCETIVRKKLSTHLHADLHVREATGNNDGDAVERYLRQVKLGKGYAWCGAFVAYHLDLVHISNPNSAWSPAYAAVSDMVWDAKNTTGVVQEGDVFTLYNRQMGRVAHVGFVVNWLPNKSYCETIEGNTNTNGSRSGIGVFKLKREKAKIYRITNYITHEKLRNHIYCSTSTVELQAKPKHGKNGSKGEKRFHVHNGNLENGYRNHTRSGDEVARTAGINGQQWSSPARYDQSSHNSGTPNDCYHQWTVVCPLPNGQFGASDTNQRQAHCSLHGAQKYGNKPLHTGSVPTSPMAAIWVVVGCVGACNVVCLPYIFNS